MANFDETEADERLNVSYDYYTSVAKDAPRASGEFVVYRTPSIKDTIGDIAISVGFAVGFAIMIGGVYQCCSKAAAEIKSSERAVLHDDASKASH